MEHFPHRVLKKIQDRLARRLRPEFLTYDAAGGVTELKEALADYLRSEPARQIMQTYGYGF